MLTSRAKYALRACVALADKFPEASWTSASELAETADVPKKFLEAILTQLREPLAMTPCASATAFRACDDCADIDTCRLRFVMRRARDAAASVLEQCSLADILATTPAKGPPPSLELVPPLGL